MIFICNRILAMCSTKKGVLFLLSKYLPIVRWIRSYSRKKFVSDIIAGVTVGITMIPQSIAYASLANLTPEVIKNYILK